jgi:hypothetical protein
MGGHPLSVLGKSRRLIHTNLRLLKWNSNVLESAGIIRRSTSPFASPLHMVPKKDESWRPSGDYRHLNMVTTPDMYPLPNMQDLSKGLHGYTFFLKSIW